MTLTYQLPQDSLPAAATLVQSCTTKLDLSTPLCDFRHAWNWYKKGQRWCKYSCEWCHVLVWSKEATYYFIPSKVGHTPKLGTQSSKLGLINSIVYRSMMHAFPWHQTYWKKLYWAFWILCLRQHMTNSATDSWTVINSVVILWAKKWSMDIKK